jgi:hypothetical protein
MRIVRPNNRTHHTDVWATHDAVEVGLPRAEAGQPQRLCGPRLAVREAHAAVHHHLSPGRGRVSERPVDMHCMHERERSAARVAGMPVLGRAGGAHGTCRRLRAWLKGDAM